VWFFSKKTTIAASGILAGAADHHSHILPGVDDGVETMDEALRILATYEALGIKHLWFTPHIMEDIPNTPQKLTARFNELKAAYTGNITLHLAAEYMIDNHLHKLLQNHCPSCVRGASNTVAEGDRTIVSPETNNSPSFQKSEYPQGEGVSPLLPIGTAGKHILVETSYYNAPIRMRETLQQIKSLGYHPLLAHPERYMYLDNAEYRKLHDEGVKFQLNLASLGGGYGSVVKKKALWFLNSGLYSVAGTDLHSEDAIEFIIKCKLSEKEIKLVERLLHNKI
jgi:tyrosine-protein phosphatase YwqE